MEKEIHEKLDELRLQMNYLCYDKEILSKFSGVWKAFYELEAALNSSSDSKHLCTLFEFQEEEEMCNPQCEDCKAFETN